MPPAGPTYVGRPADEKTRGTQAQVRKHFKELALGAFALRDQRRANGTAAAPVKNRNVSFRIMVLAKHLRFYSQCKCI